MSPAPRVETAVGLMAKAPEAGRVKTRLAAGIGEESALTVYRLLLDRSAELVTGLNADLYRRCLFAIPESSGDWFADTYSPLDLVAAQNGEHLGERMQSAFATLLAGDNTRAAVLIGTDIPDISDYVIALASAVLKRNDVVLGPASDGGYYLIGMKRIHEPLLGRLDWGGPAILGETIKLAVDLGLSIGLLSKLRDLDTIDDLAYFQRRGMFQGVEPVAK